MKYVWEVVYTQSWPTAENGIVKKNVSNPITKLIQTQTKSMQEAEDILLGYIPKEVHFKEVLKATFLGPAIEEGDTYNGR